MESRSLNLTLATNFYFSDIASAWSGGHLEEISSSYVISAFANCSLFLFTLTDDWVSVS